MMLVMLLDIMALVCFVYKLSHVIWLILVLCFG
ncbi:hypothetical protein F383_02305 [Gossypium arboreum]|uniref:Uncharacterized protein n=1 Tax=Gossypium arboreum TaxID=29729 RepID=A0A0B0P6I3_GOSAR|nr:hypothetical protein F383_02305 [Gossypium arboreum]